MASTPPHPTCHGRRSSASFRLPLAVALVAVCLAAAATAQRLPPPFQSYRATDSLLPVLDDYGQVIPESLIRSRVKSRTGLRIAGGLLGGIVGAAIGYAVSVPDGSPDCSIYEPCSDREKYYQGALPALGFVLGFLLTGVVPDYDTDRFDAINQIRRERGALRGGYRP